MVLLTENLHKTSYTMDDGYDKNIRPSKKTIIDPTNKI